MLDYGSVRNVFKSVDRLPAKNKIVAEWNMNKYQKIENYGVYCDAAPHNTSFSSSDGDISLGQNYLLFVDNSSLPSPEQEFISQVASIFRPNQPDPGIILMQKYNTTLMVKNSSDLKLSAITPSKPRYYPFTEFRRYDYFNSAKKLKTNSGYTVEGVSNAGGGIRGASPFAVYEESFPCNKIKIKVQNHLSVPQKFSIEVLVGSSWVTAYNVSQSASADFSDGILNIYYTGSSWQKVSNSTTVSPYMVTDLNELSDETPSQLMNIRGVRLSVYQMSGNNPAGLEILELSPRLEVDLSEYTESFSFDSSIGDQTTFGLPVGSLVSSKGTLMISNEGNQFLFSSRLSSLKMLSPDVKFSFFQIVRVNESTESTIPLKVLYSNEWAVQEDYSANISLEDGFKFLRETAAFDILVRSAIGLPLSSCLLFLLDNSGINGFNFITSEDDAGEDTTIRNFFSRKERTVAETLEELAIAAQCSMFFDCTGKLTVMTKEKISKKTDSIESNGSNDGTDFWMIFDENLTNNSENVAEYPYISSYNSNVVTYTESKVAPITDGQITYHVYGPSKKPGLHDLATGAAKTIIEDTVFPAGLAFFNYRYNSSIMWRPGESNDAALGAANLIKDLSDNRLKDVFTSTYTAVNEDSAVRGIYNSSTDAQKSDFIIYMDKNEGLLFGPYKGYVFIDNEFIRYNGKLYHIGGIPQIVFSDEEFNIKIRELGPGSSITFLGLVIDFEFDNIGQSGKNYIYKVIGDGRAKLDSKISKHYAFVEQGNPVIDDNNKYQISLGTSGGRSNKVATKIRYNFLERGRYKAVLRALKKAGLLNPSLEEISKSYLGFLKLEGPKNQTDSSLINKIGSSDFSLPQIRSLLEAENIKTDVAVDGNFDSYIYLNSDRDIFAQKISIPNFGGEPFNPNVVSTRMRLYSPRRKGRNEGNTQETVSSIAGIAVGLNSRGEGYYLEVEGAGSGKAETLSEGYKNNLRFYKLFLRNGKWKPYLIFAESVAAFTVQNIDVQVSKPEQVADPVFELTVTIIERPNGRKFFVRYGDTLVGTFLDTNDQTDGDIDSGPIIRGSGVSLFVRGDSQAIYEYLTAAVREVKSSEKQFLRRFSNVDDKVRMGLIPLSQQYFYKNNYLKYYYNDFASLVREVKDFDIRFSMPAFASTIIDVSAVNPEYMIKRYQPTAFGAKLIVANTSSGPILLSDETNTPLYIVGIQLEELTNGSVNMKEFYDQIDERRRRVVSTEQNKSIFGEQTFNLDSPYMQSLNQARNMMAWITRNCSRQRLKLSMEIFPNPLLELGDKVKVYDKTRGYNENNELFGQKTFVISSISYSVSNSGPGMSVDLVEVGES